MSASADSRALGGYLVLTLRLVAGFLLLFSLMVAAILTLRFGDDGTVPDAGDLVTLVAMLSLAAGAWWAASARKRRARPPDLVEVGAWVFGGVGVLMILGGIAITFDDPGGLFLVAFGAVFVGAAWLVRKVFAAPVGRRYVPASEFSLAIRKTDGRAGQYTQQTMILVDEDASEADIAAARVRWAADTFARRPDWLSGRIHTEGSRSAGLRVVGAGLWASLALGAVAAAWWFDPFFWWIAGAFGLGAVVWVFASVHGALHDRRFGDSALVLERSPLHLGGELRAELQTGVAQRLQQASRSQFVLTLSCVHRWEEEVGHGDKRRKRLRSESLWSTTHEVPGHPYTDLPIRQAATVRFEIPADLPESTLGSSRTGIFWELQAQLPLSGLDYRCTFRLPVLHPQTLPDETLAARTAA